MRRLALIVAFGFIVLTVAAISFRDGSGAHAQGTAIVYVGDSWFCEPGDSACMTTDFGDVDVVTNIDVGDSVEWQWVGAIAHTSTECSGDLDACPAPRLWDSGLRSSGSFSVNFDTPGSFLYRCQVHSSAMRGTVIVAPGPVGGSVDIAVLGRSAGGSLSPALQAAFALVGVLIVFIVGTWYVRKRWLR